jgi:cell wall assembly regulator SMI1
MTEDAIDRLGGLIPHPNKEPGPPTTPADIARVESEIGYPFPRDFAGFLLRHPEGPEILAEFLTCPVPDGRRLSVHQFYTPHLWWKGDGQSFLGYYYHSVWINGAKDLLPFARSGGGKLKPNGMSVIWNDYCVGLAGDRLGQVYLAEPRFTEKSISWDLTRIAPNFDAFLDSLRREVPAVADDGRFARLGGFGLAIWSRNSRPIRPDDIHKAEAELGHRLPEAYARLLLSHPFGPISFRRGARFPMPEGGRFHFQAFYCVPPAEDGVRPNNPYYLRKDANELLPAWLLPIGDNASGDLVCLELEGERRGGITVWEHELYNYESSDPTDDCITPVAPSFEAFLDMLEPASES